ncbi:hypothetical protein LD118_00396 [Mesoplasma lactucae ATCC 49193]|uniref:Uncharacterized protein n=2 Tax=Mesoplasma lactucae TaxID=138853 RepID=A0A291IS00_9MOLU|nr:hypothetical protein [Mesoplasma lactucae]ATG97486.1 hypothetical protein CP520_01810 [Mesoplasma lactucae ATCC 49193]ATZ20059.1 hypothetical protein MLACT_v1c02380 [Mesoplasma lactucae ATCC 49193]MCL8216807.1 hypothetical protein [Mesoplasma lactucae ATCC 49193]
MNKNYQEIDQIIEIKSDGMVNYSVVDIQLVGANRVLFIDSKKIFSQFADYDSSFKQEELKNLEDFLQNATNKFKSIYPQYQKHLEKVSLLIPNEFISFENRILDVEIKANEYGEYYITSDFVRETWTKFVNKQKEIISKENKEMAIDCTCGAVKVNGKWTKSPITAKKLTSNEISFSSEWQKINKQKFDPLKQVFDDLNIDVAKISGLNKVNLPTALTQSLYLKPSIVYEWGWNDIWVKYYDGFGNVRRVNVTVGLNDLYSRITEELNLNTKQDLSQIKNIIENHLDLNKLGFGNKNTCLLRNKNKNAVISTFTANQILKMLITKLDEVLKDVQTSVSLQMGLNTNDIAMQYQCGMISDIKNVANYFKHKNMKMLKNNKKEEVLGVYNQEMKNIIGYANNIKHQSGMKLRSEMVDKEKQIMNQPDMLVMMENQNEQSAKTVSYFRSTNNVFVRELDK